MKIDGFELGYRIQQMTAPDRRVDAELGIFFNVEAYEGYDVAEHVRIHGDDSINSLTIAGEKHQSIWHTALPRFTSSIDATMATIPGWAFPYLTYEIGIGWTCLMHNSIGIPFPEFKASSFADRPYGYNFAMLAASVIIEASQQRAKELIDG